MARKAIVQSDAWGKRFFWSVMLGLWVMAAGCAAGVRPVMRLGEPSPASLLGGSPTTSGEAVVEPLRRFSVPGRAPDSEKPWELFLGSAAHRLIAYMYGLEHPGNIILYNEATLSRILDAARVGDKLRLPDNEKDLRPDITNVTLRDVFEVKPWNERGLVEGRQQIQMYLNALNRTVPPTSIGFSPGANFHGDVLIRFAHGQHIWRLTWQTTEPGVVQYRWTRSQERFESEAAAYQAVQWVAITEEEMKQYGGWVSQAVEGMVSRRERLATFSGAVGVVIDVIGNVAVGVFPV